MRGLILFTIVVTTGGFAQSAPSYRITHTYLVGGAKFNVIGTNLDGLADYASIYHWMLLQDLH